MAESTTPTESPTESPAKIGKEMLTSIFRAPQMPGMKVLDRAAFTKRIPTVAAYVKNRRDVQCAMKAAQSVLLRDPLERTQVNLKRIYGDDYKRTFIIPLTPEIDVKEHSNLPEPLAELVKDGKVDLIARYGVLTYADFGSEELLKAILPPDASDGVQHGYTQTGHIAHMNMRDEYLPYKHTIAQVLLDKNAGIETVTYKTEEVGATSEFRTMPLEIIAGRNDTQVSVRSSSCTFEFDFRQVYWNSRLENEHDRIAAICQPGEAICDVMAGVGPFAIPAAKHNRALVWANDLNKHSYDAMVHNISLNKVTGLVQPFNADGRAFIRDSSRSLFRDAGKPITYDSNSQRTRRDPSHPRYKPPKPLERYTTPAVFSRFIMNLPGAAVEFLDAFIGLYAGKEDVFEHPSNSLADRRAGKLKLPIIHVYTFNRQEVLEDAAREICVEVSRYLQYPMRVDGWYDLKDVYAHKTVRTPKNLEAGEPLAEVMALASGEGLGNVDVPGGMTVGLVRAVAPKKSMYCATFRLPREVAFRRPGPETEAQAEDEKRDAMRRAVWEKSADEGPWPGELQLPKKP